MAIDDNAGVVNGGDTGNPNPAGNETPKPEGNQPVAKPEGQTPPPAGAKGSDDPEKRFRGIQADLARERKARQKYEADLAAARAEIEAERRRVAALAGVNVPSPEDAELEEIRARASKALNQEFLLKQLGLSPEDIQELKEAKKARERLNDVEKHVWGKHGEAMIKQVTTKLSKEYGELSDRQIAKITKAYVLEANSNPEFLERHEAGDEKLIDEFVKEWLEDFYEPAKRRITSNEAGRFRPVPDGRGRNIEGTTGGKKIDVNDPKAVEDVLVAGFRERGGEFGRRR